MAEKLPQSDGAVTHFTRFRAESTRWSLLLGNLWDVATIPGPRHTAQGEAAPKGIRNPRRSFCMGVEHARLEDIESDTNHGGGTRVAVLRRTVKYMRRVNDQHWSYTRQGSHGRT